MRKTLTIFFIFFSLSLFSQEANSWQIKQAKKISDFVSDKHDLSEDDSKFFYNAQLNQIVENALKIKELGASKPEEKRPIYRQGFNNLKRILTERFGSELANELMKSSNLARKQ